MAPQRKAVVKPEEIQENWHLRPGQGRKGKRKGWAHKATRPAEETPRTPSRPWEPGLREYPPLALVYEARPAYSVDEPPERPTL